MLKENQKYLYIGYDLDNSFEFKVTKINKEKDFVLITTGEKINTKIHKVSLSHFTDEMTKGKIKKIGD
jgi:hypothetical protein